MLVSLIPVWFRAYLSRKKDGFLLDYFGTGTSKGKPDRVFVVRSLPRGVLPGILTLVKTNKTLLVDGGVMNDVPVRHVQKQGDELIIAAEVNGGVSVEKEPQAKEAQQDPRFFLQKQEIIY
jgi:hypothetical protein